MSSKKKKKLPSPHMEDSHLRGDAHIPVTVLQALGVVWHKKCWLFSLYLNTNSFGLSKSKMKWSFKVSNVCNTQIISLVKIMATFPWPFLICNESPVFNGNMGGNPFSQRQCTIRQMHSHWSGIFSPQWGVQCQRLRAWSKSYTFSWQIDVFGTSASK